MKKLTKKEMEAIKEEERRLRSKRLNMMNQLESYWKDVEATIRVAKLNNDEETLKYGKLVEEKRIQLLNNYESIKDLSDAEIQAVRMMICNNNSRHEYDTKKWCNMKEYLPEDAVWMNDIIWREEDLIKQVELFRSVGIKNIYYTDKSTACLQAMVWFTRLNCKIVGTTNISEYNEGLIIEL